MVTSSTLQQILNMLGRPAAAAFVGGQIGRLITSDQSHGSHLRRELELALDAIGPNDRHPPDFAVSLAAAEAIELLELDLDDADARLAVHLALKLDRLLST
jgi:hypothetical protein